MVESMSHEEVALWAQSAWRANMWQLQNIKDCDATALPAVVETVLDVPASRAPANFLLHAARTSWCALMRFPLGVRIVTSQKVPS